MVSIESKLFWSEKRVRSNESHEETMTEEFKIELSQFMSGMKRKVASQKTGSGESFDEGKKSISYGVYKKLCELLFEGEGDDYAFTHMFLTLEWNLLA